MKFLINTLAIVALLTIGDVNAKSLKKIEPTPIKQPVIQPQPQQTIFDTMPTYSEIFSLLEKKKAY